MNTIAHACACCPVPCCCLLPYPPIFNHLLFVWKRCHLGPQNALPFWVFLAPKKINCMSAKILGGRDGKTSAKIGASDTGRVLTASRKRRGCSDAGTKKSAHTVDAHKAGLAFSRCVWRPRSRNRARAGDAGRGIPPSINHPPVSRASQAAQATARIVHAVQNRKRKWYWPGIRVCAEPP